MKTFWDEYSRIVGFILLVILIYLLFSTPSTILARSITTIGTELSHAAGDETHVRFKKRACANFSFIK